MNKDALYAAAIAGDADAIAKLEMEADRLHEDGKTILHLESRNGNTEHVRFILREFAHKNHLFKPSEDNKHTVLHLAAEVAEVLIDHAATHFPATSFQAFLRLADKWLHTALHIAAKYGHPSIVKLLVEADPGDTHSQSGPGKTPIYIAAERGYKEMVKLICTTCTSPSMDGPGGSTALHAAIKHPDHDIEVINLLIGAARNLPPSDNDDPVTPFQAFLRQCDEELNTALHLAVLNGKVDIVKLLVEADPSDTHTQNNEGKTPIYIAAEKGYMDIVKVICTTCTALSLELNTALHLAVLNGKVNIVKVLVEADPTGTHTQNNEGKTPIYIAVEQGYKEMVKLICKTCTAPSMDGPGGSTALYAAIKHPDHDIEVINLLIGAARHLPQDIILRLLGNAKHLATFAEDKGWTPLHYAAYHEYDSILEAIIQAQKDLGYQFVYEDMVQTPLLVAAEKGYTSTVIRLMELWPASSSAYTAINSNRRNIMHLAAAENKKEMIQGILKYCPEKYKDKILKQQDINGNTPLHLLISHGCFIPELIKHKGLDTMVRNKRNWTPRDMLYYTDDIIADQLIWDRALGLPLERPKNVTMEWLENHYKKSTWVTTTLI